MSQFYQTFYASSLGKITLVAHDTALVALCLDSQKLARDIQSQPIILQENPILAQTKTWLDAYFRGEIPNPQNIPLDPHGTDFQQSVWKILTEIPHGELITYGEIARRLGKKCARAVGGAVGRNPISIIIPCHRVVGAAQKLTGYTGGLDKKTALLQIEGVDLTRFSCS